jgi:hypothetical protein
MLADAGLLDVPSRPTPADVAAWHREGRCEGCGAYHHHKPGCKATWGEGVAATDDEGEVSHDHLIGDPCLEGCPLYPRRVRDA